MVKCSGFGCRSGCWDCPGIGKDGEKIGFHRFPIGNTDLCDKWVRANPRKNFILSKHSKLCSLHFQPEDFIQELQDTNVSRKKKYLHQKPKKRLLKDGVIPSIFPNVPVGTYRSKAKVARRSSSGATLSIGYPNEVKRLESFEQASPEIEDISNLTLAEVEQPQGDKKCDIPLVTTEKFNQFMNITETLMKFREKGFLCDTLLVAKCGREVKAHSVLLAAVSPVFMMAIEEKPSSGTFHLCFPEVDLDVLEIAVHFVYTGKLLLPTVYSQMDLLSKLFYKLSELGLSLQQLHECEKTFVRSAKQPPNSMTLSISVKVEDADSNTSVKNSVQELHASCERSVDNKPSSAEGFNETIIVDMTPNDIGTSQTKVDLVESSPSTVAKKNGQRICERERLKRKHRKTSNRNGQKEGMPSNVLVPTGIGVRRPLACPAFSVIKSVLYDVNSCASTSNSLSIASQVQNAGVINTLGSESYGRHEAIINENGEPNLKTQGDILNLVEPSSSDETLRPSGVEQLSDKASVSGNQALGCELCKEPNAETFANEIELLLHKIKHHWEQCNVCNYCGLRSSSSKNLKVHIMRHLGIYPQKNHRCNDCGLHFITPKSLKDHRVRHTGEKSHECTECKKRFSLRENMKRHQLLHSGYHRFLCDFCGKGYSRKTALMEHVTLMHEFECALCNCKQTSKANMEKHAREVHQLGEVIDLSSIIKHPETHLCDLCGRNCTSAYSLRFHLTQHKKKPQLHVKHHTDDRPFICHVCQKGFRYKSAFELHFTTHSGIKPFQCDICSKAFPGKCHLKQHIKQHMKQHTKQHTMTLSDKRRFKCGICNKLFTSKSSVTEHNRIHSGEKPYKCEICSKQFICKSGLTAHIRTHTGDKPYSCTECKMSFAQSQHLVRHMRTHTGERPFVCEICSKSYKHKIDLRYHFMRIHRIDATSKLPLNSIETNEKVNVPVALDSRDCIADELKHELEK